jgi:pyridoxine 5-phosphate synthase
MPVHLVNASCDPQWFQNHRTLLRERMQQLLVQLHQEQHSVSLVLLDDQDMARYNQTYRHKEGPTNVLSFPAREANDIEAQFLTQELGDILISVETAAKEAEERQISIGQRVTELLVHGLLHLSGYDHERSEEEAQRMQKKERQLCQFIQIRRKKMTQLAINVDHIATIRQARGGQEPDPILAAGICELAGATGIVVHLREDRRHIQDRDVRLLRETVKTRLNLEMATVKEIVAFALEIKPDLVTLVPEKREELTTEGGLDILGHEKKIKKTIAKMQEAGIPVSLFVDPDPEQIKAAFNVGASHVELHTGRYCEAKDAAEQEEEFQFIEQAAELAVAAGLRVHAGHGLNYRNTARIAALPLIEELSIGHAVIARAAFVGLDQAVREMRDCIDLAG